MSSTDELAWLPTRELCRMIKKKVVSSVELTSYFLERIERLNPVLNAFITIVPDQALAQAQAADAAVMNGEALGPLHGIPVSIKDLLWTKGIRSTGGSLVYRNFVPDEDSIVSARLVAAGGIIIGKTNTPEFGMFRRTINRLGNECVNPWDTERTSGGSSGGSAVAAAAALGPLTIGTDGGGSIRCPSAFNGVFGILPSRGRVPRYGAFLDAARNPRNGIGPIARDVEDVALALTVISGPDSRDPLTISTPRMDFVESIDLGVEGLRIAWSPDLGHLRPIDVRVVALAEMAAKVFEELGATVEEPGLRLADPFDQLEPGFERSEFVGGWKFQGEELGTPATAVEDMFEVLRKDPKTSTLLSPYVADPDLRSTLLPYILSIPPAVRNMRIDSLSSIFERYDLILTPTVSSVAPPCEQTMLSWDYTQYTYIGNLSGHPAASVPCGMIDGMPVGLQIFGRMNDEATIFRAARAFEEARPWSQHRPPIASEASVD